MMRGLMRVRLERRMHGDNERGVTLVELLVYMILLTIVLGIIASVMINALQKQREVVGISQANDRGQAVVAAVDRAVLNATAFSITPGPGKSVLLVTKTRSTLRDDNEDVARCVGFYYDSSTKKLHTVSDVLPDIDPPAALEYRASDAGSWEVLAEGIELIESAAVFAPNARDASKLDLSFEIATLDSKPPVTFRTTAGIRGSGVIDNRGSCW